MGKGGQDGNVEGVLGLAAGALVQHFAEPGFIALFIGGDQVELQVLAVISEFLQVLLQFRLGIAVEDVILGDNPPEQVLQGLLVLLLEGSREEVIALEEEVIHDHVIELPLALAGLDLEAVALLAKGDVLQGLIDLFQLLLGRFYIVPELADEVFPELALGSLTGVLNLVMVFPEVGLLQLGQLIIEG